jgi:hypothetical protein
MHEPLQHPLAQLGAHGALTTMYSEGESGPPHTEWRIPIGHPQFAPPSLASRLIGRLRRLRARWRRLSVSRGVQRLHP